jgi:hypothetical protein
MQAMLFHLYFLLLQKDGATLFHNNISVFQESVSRATLILSLDCGILWPDSFPWIQSIPVFKYLSDYYIRFLPDIAGFI